MNKDEENDLEVSYAEILPSKAEKLEFFQFKKHKFGNATQIPGLKNNLTKKIISSRKNSSSGDRYETYGKKSLPLNF